MLCHSVMHACMQGLRAHNGRPRSSIWPLLGSDCVCVCVCATRACVMRCVRPRKDHYSRRCLCRAAARHVGTSTSRPVSACVRDQGAAGRPAGGGPGWALGVGGLHASRPRPWTTRARPAAVARGVGPLFDGECRLPRAQGTAHDYYTTASKNACMSQQGSIHCSRGMPTFPRGKEQAIEQPWRDRVPAGRGRARAHTHRHNSTCGCSGAACSMDERSRPGPFPFGQRE